MPGNNNEETIHKDAHIKESSMPKFSSRVFVESISDGVMNCTSDISEKNDTTKSNSEPVIDLSALLQYNPSTPSFDKSQTIKNSDSIMTESSSTAVISESISDSDIEYDSDYSDSSNVLSAVTSKPVTSAGLLQTIEASPSFGNINVSDSNDVHIGNKTYINGPVTIKQFVQAKTEDSGDIEGLNNPAFVSTASDSNTPNLSVPPPLHQEYHNWKCKGVLWIEKRWGIDLRCKTFLLSLFCTFIIILICIMFVIIIERMRVPTVLTPSSNTEDVQLENSNGFERLQRCQYIDYCTSFFLAVGFLALCCTFLAIFLGTFRTLENNCIYHKERGYIQQGCQRSPLLPSHSLRMVERQEWLAQPPNHALDPLQTPVPHVIIMHTATEGCVNQSSCVFHVRYIQSFHIESRGWDDIGYNFLVGGDGSAYEGRGWDYVGAHTKGYNWKSIGIAFIGTFTVLDPPERQYVAAKRLIELGVELGKIAKDYKLYAHRQLIPTESPGKHVYNELQKWPHFSTDTPTN